VLDSAGHGPQLRPKLWTSTCRMLHLVDDRRPGDSSTPQTRPGPCR
jgi:hypothetical protein